MELSEFTDQDFRSTILRALRLLLILTLIALPVIWWKLGGGAGCCCWSGRRFPGRGFGSGSGC